MRKRRWWRGKDCFLLKDHKCRPLFREQVPGWVLVENIIKMVCIVWVGRLIRVLCCLSRKTWNSRRKILPEKIRIFPLSSYGCIMRRLKTKKSGLNFWRTERNVLLSRLVSTLPVGVRHGYAMNAIWKACPKREWTRCVWLLPMSKVSYTWIISYLPARWMLASKQPMCKCLLSTKEPPTTGLSFTNILCGNPIWPWLLSASSRSGRYRR